MKSQVISEAARYAAARGHELLQKLQARALCVCVCGIDFKKSAGSSWTAWSSWSSVRREVPRQSDRSPDAGARPGVELLRGRRARRQPTGAIEDSRWFLRVCRRRVSRGFQHNRECFLESHVRPVLECVGRMDRSQIEMSGNVP